MSMSIDESDVTDASQLPLTFFSTGYGKSLGMQGLPQVGRQ